MEQEGFRESWRIGRVMRDGEKLGKLKLVKLVRFIIEGYGMHKPA